MSPFDGENPALHPIPVSADGLAVHAARQRVEAVNRRIDDPLLAKAGSHGEKTTKGGHQPRW